MRTRHSGAFSVIFLLVLSGNCLQSQPSQSLDNASALAAANHLAEANEMLSAIVLREPHNLAAWLELGEVQLAQSLDHDAMNSFETVLAAQPGSSRAQAGEVRAGVAAALADRRAGHPENALDSLLRAKGYVPRSPELLIDFGIQADSMQIYTDAEEALSEAYRLEPHNERALYALAHVELDEQKTGEAEAHLREYLKVKPDDATAHYGLGHLLSMMSRNEEAKDEFGRSIALQPQQTESYYELGQIALDSHDDAAAKEAYTKVLTASPNHGGALTGMGVLAFRAKDYATADKYLQQAVVSAPGYVTAHRYYGMTLARLGKEEHSQQELTLAQDLTEKQNKQRHGYTLKSTP